MATPSGRLEAAEANNYRFSSTLSIALTEVQPSSELQFDWSALNRDFIGHAVDPLLDIDMVSLLMWSLDAQELERKLNADELAQRDLVAMGMIYTADHDRATSGSLFDMTSFGMPLDPEVLLGYLSVEDYDPTAYTYTLMAVTGTTAGEGTRMIQGFQLVPSSTNTTVALNSESTGLDYTVDIVGATPLVVPLGDPALTIDWTDMTVTALGTEFIPNSVTRLLVAHFPLPVQALEEDFLDLELRADEMYRAEVVAGTAFDLSMATSETGSPFPGVAADGGTWVVALFCGSCANPAPWYLSVLEPG
jgi:hypothetical protein